MYLPSIHFKYVGRPRKPTNYRCASSYCVVVNGLKLKLYTIENLFTGFSLRFFRLRFQYLFYMERCQFQFLYFLRCQSLYITERIGWKNLDSRFISVAVAVYFMRLFLFYLFNTARNRLTKKYNFKTMLRLNSFFFEETLQNATNG